MSRCRHATQAAVVAPILSARVRVAATGFIIACVALGSVVVSAAPGQPPLDGDPPVCSPGWIAQGRPGWRALSASEPSVTQAGQASPPGDATGPSEIYADVDADGGGLDDLSSGFTLPNDTYFRTLQRNNLQAIGAREAWGISYGGPDVTVAVISSGVDYSHPDLKNKIWRNEGEVAGNGVDDDGNGYVDDVRGWNFPERNPDPADFQQGLRGTLLSGIVAAETDNREGIAGVSWHARIMPLKVLFEYTFTEQDGRKVTRAAGWDHDVVEAVCYAANNGAGVILLAPMLSDPNAVAGTIERLRAAIDYARVERGAVLVAPAGDCGGDPWSDGRTWCPETGRYGENPEIFPAAFANVIGVQSVSMWPAVQLRTTASSGYWVDVSAPGEDFMTTNLGGGYCPSSPSSADYCFVNNRFAAVSDFAAAHVAGTVAVMRSANPRLTRHQILKHLCLNANKPDVPFEDHGDDWQRNDRFGCGVLDFEHTLETMPWSVHDVTPKTLTVLSDGHETVLSSRLENRYLRAERWRLFSAAEAPWISGDESGEDGQGEPSWVRLKTDISRLRELSGGQLTNTTVTDTLWACPVGSVNEANRQLCRGDNPPTSCPCQSVGYRLKVVERIERLFLPQIAQAALFKLATGE